jgi:hypothetical protein
MRVIVALSTVVALAAAMAVAACGTADCSDSFNAASQCGVMLTGGYCDLGKQACYDCVLAAAKAGCNSAGISACVNGSKCK